MTTPSPTDRDRQTARAELRHAILRARVHLTWKEVLRVVAECPVKDNDEPQPPLPGGQQDGRSKRPA